MNVCIYVVYAHSHNYIKAERGTVLEEERDPGIDREVWMGNMTR